MTAGSTANDAHWTVVQSNVDGAVTGPTSAVSGRVAVFDGTTGKVIKDGGKALSDIALVSELNDCLYDVTIQELDTKSAGVENGATYSNLTLVLALETYGEETKTVTKTGRITMQEASTGVSGLMPSAMYTKLNGIATGATADSEMSDEEIDAAIAAAG